MVISKGCNASFVTIILKLAERVKKVVGMVVGEEQNAFIKGRYIFDGVLIANETMEFLKKKKEKGIIFKGKRGGSEGDGGMDGLWRWEFPFTYLGLPIGENIRRVNTWNPVVEKFKKRLADWRAKNMSFGGHLTLVKSFLGRQSLGWGGFRVLFGFYVGDGRDVRFWVDRWVDDRRLCDRFLRLFHLDRKKEGSVMDKGLWVNDGWHWEYNWVRDIRSRVCKEFDDLLGVWQDFVVSNNCRDKWIWAISKDNEFKVKDLTRLVKEKIEVENGYQETI
uniref:Reverse transcriptase domain, reverse transcriptase zinc-binding domain protein n=1 Tax=Tanacetum cinerariifolium TaxID=118510 RepID=A0A6L2M3K0_TANCI|nr:reverse transcriptase domain, reverse transcriptase zinc-binding domain protein [Tanacetum cinerariifolium]